MDDLGELMIRRAIITFDYVMLGRWLNSGSVKDACIRMIIPRSNLPTLSLSLYIYIYIYICYPPPDGPTYLVRFCAHCCGNCVGEHDLSALEIVCESTISRFWDCDGKHE